MTDWACSCGCDGDWVDCWRCGGECCFDLHDEDPVNHGPGETEDCGECAGEGGWRVCVSRERAEA
jgi:hypothetical protein